MALLSVQDKLHYINPELLTRDLIEKMINQQAKLILSDDSIEKITHCRAYLDDKLSHSDALFYGINTGFGYLQNVQIDKEQIAHLQYNLLQSHACGLGEEVPASIVKLMLFLKIQSLAYGHSGVQLQTVQRLIDFYNYDILPVVYTQGSLGASGDLSPLSHMSLSLIGLGEVYFQGKKYHSQDLLTKFGWTPIELSSKEGIALINGTQFMSAYGLHCLMQAARLIKWADVISAISVDAFDGSAEPFHERIHAVRPHKGQIQTATRLRNLLKHSPICNLPKKQVQDPYSFRCIPQVHGASKDAFAHVNDIILQEINSVTDNPNIFPDDDLILSGGNFHGQPLALGFDYLCMAMAELGNISERRTYQLLSGQRGLPLFLVKNPGLHSGLMIPQYTAAGIVSENKQLCTPSSVDSITSSNGQEDHVSMGANGATKCLRVINNLEKVLAIELLTASQALEFRRPLQTSVVLEDIVAKFRQLVPFNETDRVLSTDMHRAIEFLRAYPLSAID
ncbi:histidine ammonia-lyase [Cytophagaceae bacterium DM2B3-1]|uniref:Histidine ammonia-lyase n=1 Tax=Xanthocytophaga flava TaxID=3048013 RepID=A0ABT7CSN2_9BACT|nr:histidine ammonia-lyase [Xanthocytophaga flavus]MDJ1471382.1 histidine ammonia-lyase [Xanthocytophaga flavus]MDJ1496742.1 histidine ammonia-lyase [Xanthocytophaga flavus]